jgi:hypothetical protein
MPETDKTTTAVTDNASAGHALSKMARIVRSVLGNAFGLPLLLLLDFLDSHTVQHSTCNKIADEKAGEKYLCKIFDDSTSSSNELFFLDTLFPDFVSDLASPAAGRDTLSTELGATIGEWYRKEKRTETMLTKAICATIDNSSCLQKSASSFALEKAETDDGFNLRSTGEVTIQDSNDRGRYDILVTDNSTGAPLVLFEFGLNNEKWWKKLDQGLIYVEILSSHEDVVKDDVTVKQFDQKPMLLSIVTVDKENGDFKIALFLCWRKFSRRDEPDEDEVIDPAFYVALLWRKQSTDAEGIQQKQEALSNALANALVAAVWLQSKTSLDFYEVYSALGPNCCKIKDKVSASETHSQHVYHLNPHLFRRIADPGGVGSTML